MSSLKTFSELRKIKTFRERFEYLKLESCVGDSTFGFDRAFNQKFYRSSEWKHARDNVIVRDNGCDLGVEGYEINGKIIVHHLNPITLNDIVDFTDLLISPEYLITTTLRTHNALHYSDEKILEDRTLNVRFKNDTCPWRQ